MGLTDKFRYYSGFDLKKPREISEPRSRLAMARLVFDSEYHHNIKKSFLTTIKDDGSFLVPADVRKDTRTDLKHISNEIEKQSHYSIGLLLADPEGTSYHHKFRRYFTVRFNGYVTIDGRITIPYKIREGYNITSGQTIQVAFRSKLFKDDLPQKSYSSEHRTIPDVSELTRKEKYRMFR